MRVRSRLSLVLALLVLPGLALTACAAARWGAGLPPDPARLAQLGRRASAAQRGWVDLLFGPSAKASGALWRPGMHSAGGALPRLGRAMELEAGGGEADAVEAWLELAQGCVRRPEPLCQLALGHALQRVWSLDAGLPARLRARLKQIAARVGWRERELALRSLVRLARRAGAPARLHRLQAARGCGGSWHVSGPGGKTPLLDLDRGLKHRGDGRVVRLAGCQLPLRTDHKWGGVYLATARARLSQGGAYVVWIDTDAPWRLQVDGRVVWSHGQSRRREPRSVAVGLRLTAGAHRLALALGSVSGVEDVTLRLVAQRPQVGAPPVVTAARLSLVGTTDGAREGRRALRCAPDLPPLSPAWLAPLGAYLRGAAALRCGDFDEAHRQLGYARRLAPRFAAARRLAARLLRADPLVPRQVGLDRAVNLLSTAALDDGAAGLALAQARLDQGMSKQALRQVQRGARRWPRMGRWALLEHAVQRDLSHSTEEERALVRARSLLPHRCELLEDLAGIYRLRRDVAARLRLAFLAQACDAGSDLLARVARRAGLHRWAAREYGAVLRLRPTQRHLHRELAAALELAGDGAAARRQLSRLLVLDPGAVAAWVELADSWSGDGQRRRAVGLLRDARHRMPWESALRRALQGLSAASVMAPYRRQGLDVIRRYQGTSPPVGVPAVIVQDRVVTRLLPGGASLSLTHNIVHVLSKGAVQRWGEVRVPHGAQVLTLRTVKRDGTSREPESIPGKETISLPGLEPGDFVETELLEARPPDRMQRGRLGQRFYFVSFEAPVVSSEYEVIAPRRASLVVDRRGRVSPARRRADGDLQVWSWIVRQQPRAHAEPAMAPAAEYLPSVQVTGIQDWSVVRDHFLQRALVATRRSWFTHRRARALVAGATDDETRLRRIVGWVLRNVEPSADRFRSATSTLLDRAGGRAVLIKVLLAEVGIDARLWLARPVDAPHGAARRPVSGQGFDELLLSVRLGGEPLLLHPASPHAPLGHLPPRLEGALALVLDRWHRPVVRVPRRPTGQRVERRVVSRAELGRDGSAQVSLVEQLSGQTALSWRQALERLGRPRWREALERSHVATLFPGATLQQVRVEQMARPDRPLTLRLRLRVPALCRREGGGLRCPVARVHAGLRRSYLRDHASRRFPAQISRIPATREVLELVPPPGLRLIRLPAQRTVRAAQGRLEQRARPLPRDGVRIATGWAVVGGRVAPSGWRDFAHFARQLDLALEREVAFASR